MHAKCSTNRALSQPPQTHFCLYSLAWPQTLTHSYLCPPLPHPICGFVRASEGCQHELASFEGLQLECYPNQPLSASHQAELCGSVGVSWLPTLGWATVSFLKGLGLTTVGYVHIQHTHLPWATTMLTTEETAAILRPESIPMTYNYHVSNLPSLHSPGI